MKYRIIAFILIILCLSSHFSLASRKQKLKHTDWLEPNREAIKKLIREHGKRSPTYVSAHPPVATFDWDNTMILNDVGDATFHYLVDHLGFVFNDDFWGLMPIPVRSELKMRYDRIRARENLTPENPDVKVFRKLLMQTYGDLCTREGDEVCYAWVAKIMTGMTPNDVERAARDMLAHELEILVGTEKIASDENDSQPLLINRGIRYYSEMTALVKEFKKNGFDVWVVSASTQWIVEEAAERVGIPPDHVIGILPELDDAGKILPRLRRFTYRQGKADAIGAIIGKQPVFAAGDSNTDIEMLLLGSGPRLVIDRGKAPLMQIAKERGWLVQPRFLHPN